MINASFTILEDCLYSKHATNNTEEWIQTIKLKDVFLYKRVMKIVS